jgi:putative oxidoreductase
VNVLGFRAAIAGFVGRPLFGDSIVSVFEATNSLWRERMLSVLRFVAALLFLEHGTQKMFNVPMSAHPMAYHFASLIGLAGVLESCGGLALLLGLFTRPVAFLLSGEMAVAYFKVHILRNFYPVNNGGDNVVLFCFLFLYLVFAGPGVWSIDAAIAASRRRGAPARDGRPAPAPAHRQPG